MTPAPGKGSQAPASLSLPFSDRALSWSASPAPGSIHALSGPSWHSSEGRGLSYFTAKETEAQGREAAGFGVCASWHRVRSGWQKQPAAASQAARVLPAPQPPTACSSERKGPSPRVGSLSSSPAWMTLTKPPTQI